MKNSYPGTGMTPDLEKVIKAEQGASLLLADLRDLARSDNLILADVALSEIRIVAELHIRLQRLSSNLQQMEEL